ncbi:Hypothetical protein NGAL_HAMBI1146_34240 [Neorhizobium galegae bv. officinalis]|nr:hypothetical protein [Neorhizobium galegae]CDZ39532.1 Hypothetical protein NGAL_HAMBI1146_34240 [Neorhizobium galegae bv. officinalis]
MSDVMSRGFTVQIAEEVIRARRADAIGIKIRQGRDWRYTRRM